MDAIERALEEAVRRQKEGIDAVPAQQRSAIPSGKRLEHVERSEQVDPFSPEAVLRAANEDDDLYDPYSDYMDMLSASEYEDYDGQELI